MSNTKRIAKNTIVLYVRMVIVLFITLYTSRIVLQALGVDDFGLYGVIGGVVGLFAFLQTSMGKATQRFLNVEMVAKEGDLKAVFQTCWTIHVVVAVVILILAETIGLWFLNAKVNIPEGREFAANILYQTTIVSLCISMLVIPFSAEIIAHEKMGFFAVISIIDAVLKLGIAFIILAEKGDRLIIYGALIMCISIINILLYYIYCKKKFKETSVKIRLDKQRFKDIFGFVGWTLLGQAAIVGCNQGNAVLVNIFHSVAANAAMTIGGQVSSTINNLAGNFQTAFNPQITKSYAEGDYSYLKFLVFTTSKISYCLLFVAALPVAINIDWVLELWLGIVPEMTNVFCILCIANGIINALSAPLNFSVLATGRIKWFQIVTAAVYLSDIVILYVLFRVGMPPTTAMWVKVSIMVVILFVRLYYAHKEIPCIGLRTFTLQVILPLLLMSVGSVTIALVLMQHFDNLALRISLTVTTIIVNIILIWFAALSRKEKDAVLGIINKKRNKNA